MKLYLNPLFDNEDEGDGGIRRIVEAQKRHLPKYDVEFVKNIADANLVAIHAGAEIKIPTNVPLVAHCHGLYWAEYTWPSWANVLNKRVIESIRTADIVTAPSEWVADAIRRGAWINPEVIYHGVEPDEWTPGDNKGYVLWNKTRIDAVCDPGPVNELAQLAPKINFISTFAKPASNITITGRVAFDKAREYIQDAGIYLCTTRETFGIGTLEAMLCGVPILGFAWGGQTEIVQHKVTGWLCNPGDFKSLTEGLHYCLQHRSELGTAARQYVLDNFIWSKVIERYFNVYQRAVDSVTSTKVSVVIPCYNLAQLLPEAIESVLKQDYDDYEVVVVNDASPDNTLQVAEQYAAMDSRVKVVHNETNQYLAGALNTGISKALGEYIIPLDADNMLEKGALKVLASALDADRSLDIVYGSFEVIEPDGKRYVSKWPPKEFSFAQQMSHHNQIVSTSMYRKRIWSRIGGYRTRCKTAEDADFWCRATSYGAKPAKVTDNVTLIYRNRYDSMSHTNKDWAWHKWYPWFNNPDIAPYTAPVAKPYLHSYEPPYISVIIPVGPEHEKYVIDAIDSVIAQTFNRYEIIVVNDSFSTIDWLPPFVKVIRTSGAQGPAIARNLGIKAARGHLFIPLDADDLLHPEALQQMYDVWQQLGGYIYTDWVVQENNEQKLSPNYNCNDILKSFPHPVTALYPVQAWRDVNGFDESLDTWEDWDFVIAINAAGYCGVRLAAPLFYYRMTTGYRREEMQIKKAAAKAAILEKWSEYISGGQKLMACGGCYKGGKAKVKVAIPTSSETIMVEYLRDDGPINYKGPKTGTNYRFGLGHKVRAVNRGDAEVFLQRSEFRLAVNAVR